MIPLIPTIFLLLTAYAVTALGQPLNGRVLVVQNSTSADSIALADYYIAQRSIPAANRCVITSPSTTSVTLAEYRSQIRDPIRACLNAAGPQNILYIVMTYGVPYSISDVRRFAVDSFVADIWDRYTTQVFQGRHRPHIPITPMFRFKDGIFHRSNRWPHTGVIRNLL